MRLLFKAPDGGAKSGVTGYFLVESKALFSVVLLHFARGTREAYHSHAFSAITWWLKGNVIEHDLGGGTKPFSTGNVKRTPRAKFHKIEAITPTWAISFRGPWADHWYEFRGSRLIKLGHGRVELE